MEQAIANPEATNNKKHLYETAAAFLERKGSCLKGRPQGFRFEQPDFLFDNEWPLLNRPCGSPFPEDVIFRVSINPGQTIDEIIACGNYAPPKPTIYFGQCGAQSQGIAQTDVVLLGFFRVVVSTTE